jgi:hypothetical protein
MYTALSGILWQTVIHSPRPASSRWAIGCNASGVSVLAGGWPDIRARALIVFLCAANLLHLRAATSSALFCTASALSACQALNRAISSAVMGLFRIGVASEYRFTERYLYIL